MRGLLLFILVLSIPLRASAAAPATGCAFMLGQELDGDLANSVAEAYAKLLETQSDLIDFGSLTAKDIKKMPLEKLLELNLKESSGTVHLKKAFGELRNFILIQNETEPFAAALREALAIHLKLSVKSEKVEEKAREERGVLEDPVKTAQLPVAPPLFIQERERGIHFSLYRGDLFVFVVKPDGNLWMIRLRDLKEYPLNISTNSDSVTGYAVAANKLFMASRTGVVREVDLTHALEGQVPRPVDHEISEEYAALPTVNAQGTRVVFSVNSPGSLWAIKDLTTGKIKYFTCNDFAWQYGSPVGFFPDGDHFIMPTFPGNIYIVQASTGQASLEGGFKVGTTSKVMVGPRGDYVLAGQYGSIFFARIKNYKAIKNSGRKFVPSTANDTIADFDISSDGRTLVAGTLNGEIIFWDIKSGRLLAKHYIPITTTNAGNKLGVSGMAFIPGTTRAFLMMGDGRVFTVDPAKALQENKSGNF